MLRPLQATLRHLPAGGLAQGFGGLAADLALPEGVDDLRQVLADVLVEVAG